MKNDLQEIRRSAVVSLFGPGAIVDFRADGGAVSGVVTGLEEWDRSFPPRGLAHPQVIRETRLQKKLGVKGFRAAPVVEARGGDNPDNRRLVAVRFPQWLQCPQCDRIKPASRWKSDPGKASCYCPTCTETLGGGKRMYVIPVRFVMACENGHLDEFPWDWWVGHKEDCPIAGRRNPDRHPGLILRSEGPGLSGLMLSCPECKARRSMDGIFSKKTWENSPPCRGRRPWLCDADESCDKKTQAMQRGASNLYFPVVESALDIPPWSDSLQEALGTWWNTLTNLDDLSQLDMFISFVAQGELGSIMRELRMTPAELAEAIRARLTAYEHLQTDNLRPDEYRQFMMETGSSQSKDGNFKIRNEPVSSEMPRWISKVVRVVRLREVRALKGFTRIKPPEGGIVPVARLSKSPLDWLPAIEVRGEGIFLALNEETLKSWEIRDDVQQRVEACNKLRLLDLERKQGSAPDKLEPLTPRYVLCHTLAHALMRQLSLECGYTSASLRERIYAGTDTQQMAGVLIYTATPDADGTLGGLERQGKSQRIADILYRAIHAIEWCSSDPLCISDMMGANASYSKSVCHACCLAPETSCEAYNCYLDRVLLVGDGTGSGLGYFEDMFRRG
mgnify:CR=1 FL=1